MRFSRFLKHFGEIIRGCGRARRASVPIVLAAAMVPMLIAVSTAIDFSRLADGRATLQRAVDNAALSGAAAYSVNATAAKTRASVEAVSAFCETTATMPVGFTVTGIGSQACAGSASTSGPTVTSQIGGYKSGTLGIIPSSCSAGNPIIAGLTCGFIVTVTARATMNSWLPAFFGMTQSVTVTGIAANPFINLASSLHAQVLGSAFNTNAIWIYPLLLDSNGNPDFTTNAGAIPQLTYGVYPADATPSGCASSTNCGSAGTAAGVNCLSSPASCTGAGPSACTDNPLQFTCGSFTMIADTYYNTTTNPCLPALPCYPNGLGTYPEFIQGVVQNPQAPVAIITATTPLGVAFQSLAGGNTGYGYGGYQTTTPANHCYYPGNAVYQTVAQVYSDALDNITLGSPALDWPKITHWFYSSYLANGWPPSEGEILSQYQLQAYTSPGGSTVYYNTRVPSIGNNTTGIFLPTLATCANPAGNGSSYDQFLTTTYPSSGATNASLFILDQTANAAYISPASTGLAYVRYTPNGTPGYQYAALSCQAYGTDVFTFYWNDMGGSQAYGDDLDYNNGTLRVQCSPSALVTLIG